MLNNDVFLLRPANDVITCPEVTILIPAKNEEITISEFVEWCKIGLLRAHVTGQILIVDSSIDKTKELALEHGAEVLAVPPRGLGRAYIDAIPYIKGKFVIMGDADLTYDMKQIEPFIKKFREGYEFIMGSRFKGKIEKGAMPPLHRYFGTPITTWILNRVYKCHFSDIHCGIRGMTLQALKRIKLQSQGWEYASEMLIKAIHLNLKSIEVPVVFYKDREGRISHHKRMGWFAPWLAGWVNLKAILIFGANFFLYKIGIIMTLLGLLGTTLLYNGPIMIGKINFQLHWMFFFLIMLIAGLQFFCMGILAKAIYDIEMKKLNIWKKIFSLELVLPLTGLYILLAIISILPLLTEYINLDFRLPTISFVSYHAIGGLGLILIGMIYFASALLFNAILLDHQQNNLAYESKMVEYATKSQPSINTSFHHASYRIPYGQKKFSFVDRFGIFLSLLSIKKYFPKLPDLEVIDLGCGYKATLLLALQNRIKKGIGVDFSISPELKKNPSNLTFIESPIEESFVHLIQTNPDVIMLTSVLEHLDHPIEILHSCYNLLKNDGILLINVPTWRGKFFLEFSAFKLGTSPQNEMDDHKMYYDKKDLWPLLIQAGFKPSKVILNYHKFGLNLFAAAYK